jgi:hypothetical protein
MQTDTDAATDNVTPIRPDVTPEPQPREARRKDHRAAARKAKSRSKNKRDRDISPVTGALVHTPPIAPTVTQAEGDRVTPPAPVTPPEWRTMAPVERPAERHGRGVRRAAFIAALSLASVSAYFAITGMTAIFVGAFWAVIGMGVALEVGKLSAVAALPTLRRGGLKTALGILVTVLMALNAVGCYGFLAKAHIGHQVEGDVAVAGRSAEVDGRMSVQAEKVADLTKQIADLDAARTIETPSAGNLRTASAISAQAAALAAAAKLRAADDERRQAKRTSLADRLTVEAKALAEIKIEKAKIDGDRKVAEADLGPVRYLATLIGAGDQEVLRLFILVIAVLLGSCGGFVAVGRDPAVISAPCHLPASGGWYRAGIGLLIGERTNGRQRNGFHGLQGQGG